MRDYVNICHEFNFISLIDKPTRVTSHSATCVDHIWSNAFQDSIESGVFLNDASDHFSPFVHFTLENTSERSNSSGERFHSYRVLTNCKTDEFKAFLSNKLNEYDWTIDCVDTLMQNFINF